MSDMTDERMIEVLRKEGREYRAEIKGLRDIEDFRVSVIRKLETENKALKEMKHDLLKALEFYAHMEEYKVRWFLSDKGEIAKHVIQEVLKEQESE